MLVHSGFSSWLQLMASPPGFRSRPGSELLPWGPRPGWAPHLVGSFRGIGGADRLGHQGMVVVSLIPCLYAYHLYGETFRKEYLICVLWGKCPLCEGEHLMWVMIHKALPDRNMWYVWYVNLRIAFVYMRQILFSEKEYLWRDTPF